MRVPAHPLSLWSPQVRHEAQRTPKAPSLHTFSHPAPTHRAAHEHGVLHHAACPLPAELQQAVEHEPSAHAVRHQPHLRGLGVLSSQL